jgi:hypothetical protein
VVRKLAAAQDEAAHGDLDLVIRPVPTLPYGHPPERAHDHACGESDEQK